MELKVSSGLSLSSTFQREFGSHKKEQMKTLQKQHGPKPDSPLKNSTTLENWKLSTAKRIEKLTVNFMMSFFLRING